MRIAISVAVLLSLLGYAEAEVFQYFDEEGTLIVTITPHETKKRTPHPPVQPKTVKLNYKEDVLYDYYPVYGKDFHELMASTKINGPFDSHDNKRYAAQTRWNLGWSYTFNSTYRVEGSSVYVSLNISDIEFRSDVSVLLPALPENANLDYQDLKLWETFLQGLLEHEHDHVNITRDPYYRNEAVSRISGIRELTFSYDPRSDIESTIKRTVESETARIGHDLIRAIKNENEEYDRVTEHGLKPEMRRTFFR